MPARVISQHGRHAWVIDQDGVRRHCVMKGRELSPVANDMVQIDSSADPAVITAILPRHHAMQRSEAHRAKTLAANVDQLLVVVAGSPPFSDELLARVICSAVAADISGAIVINKIDLADAAQKARGQLEPFSAALHALGWPIFESCAKGSSPKGLKEIQGFLSGKTTLVMGQSGMGKSSLMNVLIPGLDLQTQEISQALQTGRHTTTASKMFASPAPNTWVIDTPGFQVFGLHHLSESEMALGFPEWGQISERDGRCRFFNCRHNGEPQCVVSQAATSSSLLSRRLALWRALISSS